VIAAQHVARVLHRRHAFTVREENGTRRKEIIIPLFSVPAEANGPNAGLAARPEASPARDVMADANA
jgi:hypothetical protein